MLIEPIVGKAYYYKKQRVKVVLSSEGNHCERCALQGEFICQFLRCCKTQRADGKSIHFELPKLRRKLHTAAESGKRKAESGKRKTPTGYNY